MPLVSFVQMAGATLKLSSFASSAVAVRAVVLAVATFMSSVGLRSICLLNRGAVRVTVVGARRVTELAPTTSNRRRLPFPIKDNRPNLSLPPAEFWCGTSPN